LILCRPKDFCEKNTGRISAGRKYYL